jgi:hypothetical protein
MKAETVFEGDYCLHADVSAADLFEGIRSIPIEVSLNTYIERGEKPPL